MHEVTEDLLAGFWQEDPPTCSRLLASFLAHFDPARQLAGPHSAKLARAEELLHELAAKVLGGEVPEVPADWEHKRAGIEALQRSIRRSAELLAGRGAFRALPRPLRPTEFALSCRAFAGECRLQGDALGSTVFEEIAKLTEGADLAHRVILRGELRRAWVRSRAQ